MKVYQVLLVPAAEKDLEALKNYIVDVLKTPQTALAYIRSLREMMISLSEMPARYKVFDDESWHSYGIRRVLVKNTFIYYRIDDNEKNVFILGVIYSKRDQLRQLKKMNFD